MTKIEYVGADGKTYYYDLDEQKVLDSINLQSVDLSQIQFIKWDNPNFDVPINMPQGFGDGMGGFFDLHYQNTLNSLSYLGNMSKSENKEDFDRWYGKFKDTIMNELIYEMGILKKMVDSFNSDYGYLTPQVSQKISEVENVANEAKRLLSKYESMKEVVKVLTDIASTLAIIGQIITVLEVISNTVLMQAKPQREEAIIKQSQKVQNLIEAYKSDALKDMLNRFDPPKSLFSANNPNTLKFVWIIIIVAVFILILYKRNNEV